MDAAVPRVEIADHADAARVRRPHREVHAGADAVRDRVRAELVEGLQVRAFAEQVDVERREHGTVAIRIVDLARRSIGPLQAQAVIEILAHRIGDHDLVDAVDVHAIERARLAARAHHELDTAQVGTEDAYREAGSGLVRTEDRERIRMLAANEGVDLRARQRRGHRVMVHCRRCPFQILDCGLLINCRSAIEGLIHE
jgi:hypothetical protein